MAADVKPTLTINGHDYAKYVEDLEPSRNDLDADGSGRDVQTGEMFRTRIAQKLKFSVRMLRLQQSTMTQLMSDINSVFFQATVVDPATGATTSKNFYTATVNAGAQRYNKDTGAPYYDGVSFEMTEK